jgi:hypothetical protein
MDMNEQSAWSELLDAVKNAFLKRPSFITKASDGFRRITFSSLGNGKFKPGSFKSRLATRSSSSDSGRK